LTSVSIKVPGRLEVFGKHTDYAGGRSLVCAVPRGIRMTAEPTRDGRVVIRDLESGESFEFSGRGDGRSDGWGRYPRTALRRLATNFPGTPISARLEFTSDLPQAAGMSSSSALIVAVAEALIACAGIEDLERWRAAIRTPEDRAGYFGCIENGASFGPLAGDSGVGTHGGSEDHAAIVMSRAGELRQFSFSPLHLDRVVTMPAGWTFVVSSSGVAAEKAGAANADYNRLSQMTAAIVATWRGEHPDDGRSLADLVRAGDAQKLRLSSVLRTRLDHFIAEDARVADASDAFARGDVAAIGELARASQDDADRMLGNQIPETRDLVSLATDIGAAAASAFGAGWGGSVWALVPLNDAPRFLEEWLRAYQGKYPPLRRPVKGRPTYEGFVAPPSAGISSFQLPAPSS
jgi:galactokinase